MLIFLFAAACAFPVLAESDDAVTITFRVRVPPSTPADSTVHLAGSLAEVGRWKADGVPLKRGHDRRWETRVVLPKGATLEYKLTLGAWSTVEKDERGADIANRRLALDRDRVVELEVASWASGKITKPEPTLSGDIRFHRGFRSNQLANTRDIAVWLPPDYEKRAGTRYPVLYLHDGQNVFDRATAAFGVEWRADETAGRLSSEDKIDTPIIVAISNTSDRMNEYTYHKDSRFAAGGRGDRYAKFLIEEVKPFLDRTYRTRADRANTALGGSSLGGLISLEIAARHPDVFGRCAVISPTLGWSDGRVLAELAERKEALRSLKIWVDMGTKEGSNPERQLANLRQLAKLLQEAGLTAERDFHCEEVPDAAHNEAAWSARFDRVLKFLFPPRP